MINGDAKATIYVSRAASAPGASAAWSLASGSTVISSANSIATMQGASGIDLTLAGGFEGATEAADTGGRGVLQTEGGGGVTAGSVLDLWTRMETCRRSRRPTEHPFQGESCHARGTVLCLILPAPRRPLSLDKNE